MAHTLIRSAPAFAEPSSRTVRSWKIPSRIAGAFCCGPDGPPEWIYPLLFSKTTWGSVADLVSRLFPPDLSLPFLKVALRATWSTAATAVVATTISALLALPLGVLASGRLWRMGITAPRGQGWSSQTMMAVSWFVLHGMGVLRSVPDLVWALLFVAGLGLGPLAGTSRAHRLLHCASGQGVRGHF